MLIIGFYCMIMNKDMQKNYINVIMGIIFIIFASTF